jgi:hypothetical protein
MSPQPSVASPDGHDAGVSREIEGHPHHAVLGEVLDGRGEEGLEAPLDQGLTNLGQALLDLPRRDARGEEGLVDPVEPLALAHVALEVSHQGGPLALEGPENQVVGRRTPLRTLRAHVDEGPLARHRVPRHLLALAVVESGVQVADGATGQRREGAAAADGQIEGKGDPSLLEQEDPPQAHPRRIAPTHQAPVEGGRGGGSARRGGLGHRRGWRAEAPDREARCRRSRGGGRRGGPGSRRLLVPGEHVVRDEIEARGADEASEGVEAAARRGGDRDVGAARATRAEGQDAPGSGGAVLRQG